MSLEVRAADDATRDAFHRLASETAAAVAAQRRVAFDFDAPIVNPAVAMSDGWIDRLAALCEEEAIPYLHMPSGAGHDAAVFAAAGVPSGMLFVRNRYGSHNPAEHMELDDLEAAVRVLIRALLTPAGVER